MALRLKPLPLLLPLGSNPAGIESTLPNLPGQSTSLPTPGFPLRGDRAIDHTSFPDKKTVTFSANYQTIPALSSFPPSVTAQSEAERDDAASASSSKLPFFFCKISAKHLPSLDVFSASDPVCFVRELASNVIVHRTEVIPDECDPDFQKPLRLKPRADSVEASRAGHVYMYDPQHELSFAVYDSCRTDALASSSALSDSDLEPLGAVNVKIADLLHRIEMHEADPRTPLYLKFDLKRDATQSALSKTFEKLGQLQSKMNLFNQQSQKVPKLVLQLTLIRSIGVNERFCWQSEDIWGVVDRGVGEATEDADSKKTIVSLLEMNPSHLRVIETAVARAAAVSDETIGNSGVLATDSAAAPPAIHTLALSARGFKLACLGTSAKELPESGDFQNLVRVMSDLKEAALKRPKDFYAAGALGEPAVVYPFVLSLHTLKEDLDVNDDVGLLDWWDVLKELKKGLLACAIRCSEEGRPVLDDLKDLYECDEFCISSIEEGVECEFQWMLCQQYTNRNMRLSEAWHEVQKLNLTRSISNEYTGENVLHVLIVQGGRTGVHISKLFSLVTLLRYKMCLLGEEVSGRFFCPVFGGGIVDLGRTPMHFAVCTGQGPVVRALLHQCSDSKQRHHLLWKRDSLGNTILHMCVLHNMHTMYDILVSCMEDLERELKNSEWWHIKSRLSLEDDDNLKNYDGYTVSCTRSGKCTINCSHALQPVEYAAIKGNKSFICHIIERDKITKWEYGSVSLNMFLVRDFDTYKTNVCDRAPKLEVDKEAGKMSYFQYAFKNFAAYTRARPSVEPNVLDLLVEHEHKSLLTTLPLVQGLLDHKWQTFGRQLLSTWFVIIAIIFIIFEVNVYRAADQTAQEDFTELEYVSGSLVWPVLQYLTPDWQVQISFALAVLFGTFWYLADLGIPAVHDKSERGIPLKYRIHSPEAFEEVKFKRLVGAEMPSWMMTRELEDRRRQVISDAEELGKAQKKHLGHLVDEYEKLVFDGPKVEHEKLVSDGLKKRQKTRTQPPSLQQYLRDGPRDDSYLETRDCSVLTRAGGKLLPQKQVREETRIRRMSIAGLQKNIKDFGASVAADVKDLSGSLQQKFNEVVHGAEASDIDVQPTKTISVYEVLKLLVRFAYHVFIGGATDGINSMLQTWALLVLISALFRVIAIPDVEVINTALMSLASISFFVSFGTFYRVNSRLGPFMALLNTMLATDFVTWLFIVLLFLAGTGQALYIIQDTPMVFLGVFKWMMGSDSTAEARSEELVSTYQAYIIIIFVALSLILSVALLNVLVAMFGSTYGKVMDSAREEWQLQRASTILLLERVLYFLPAILIYPLGYRVLHPAPGKRKVIMRFVLREKGGTKYHWVNTRCCARNAINPSHSEILLELDGSKTVFPTRWHSFFTAQVPRYVAEYNQVESDDDYVYLLQMISSAKSDQYCVPDA